MQWQLTSLYFSFEVLFTLYRKHAHVCVNRKKYVIYIRWHSHGIRPRKAFCDTHGIAVEAWSPLSGQNASALSDPTVKDSAQNQLLV